MTAHPSPVSIAASEPDLDAVMLRVGRLNYVWSNTESLLIHMLAGLTGMPTDAAVVVFLSVNSTRTRIEMVQRLAKLKPLSAPHQRELLTLTADLSRLQAVRNRYNHSIWSFEDDGSVSTILMRIADRRDRIHMGRKQNLGDAELGKLDRALQTLSTLNRAIWQFLRRYDYPIG